MKQKKKNDRELANAIFEAWAAVGKAICEATDADLDVDARNYDSDSPPIVTRSLYRE